MQPAGHLLPGHEQAAQQQLGEDQCGHELDGLELRPCEGAREQSEGHTQQRVGDRE